MITRKPGGVLPHITETLLGSVIGGLVGMAGILAWRVGIESDAIASLVGSLVGAGAAVLGALYVARRQHAADIAEDRSILVECLAQLHSLLATVATDDWAEFEEAMGLGDVKLAEVRTPHFATEQMTLNVLVELMLETKVLMAAANHGVGIGDFKIIRALHRVQRIIEREIPVLSSIANSAKPYEDDELPRAWMIVKATESAAGKLKFRVLDALLVLGASPTSPGR